MKTRAQLAESIDRFQKVFWERRADDRPPVGVVDSDIFLPMKYSRRALPSVVSPEVLTPDAALTDYGFAAANRRVTCDDWMPFAAPWRAVPWLEAACGCEIRCADGMLAPAHFAASMKPLAALPLPASPRWLELMKRETARLQASVPEDCWVSPSILRGPSDVLAAMRGMDNFFCDVFDDATALQQAASRVNQLLLRALEDHFRLVAPRHGGYGHIYGYWAPGPTVVIQEDAMGLCKPEVYREHFQALNAAIVERLGGYVLFHLHSNRCGHWRDVLAVPGLAGLEVTVESTGPSLHELLPMLREILEQSRLILYVDHGFEQLSDVLAQLPRTGLFVLVREDHVPSNEDFHRFVQGVY